MMLLLAALLLLLRAGHLSKERFLITLFEPQILLTIIILDSVISSCFVFDYFLSINVVAHSFSILY